MSDLCGACTADDLRPLWRIGAWSYAACPHCGHAQLAPLPSAAESERLYDDGYFVAGACGGYADYLADESLHRLNARDRLRRIGRRATPGRLLDFGCAAGFFLDEARQAGWEVAGADCSPWARRIAGERFGYTITPDWPAVEIPFATISLFQILEHLADPLAALRAAAERLAPGGLLIVETWDRASLVARCFGRHWQQVSPPSVVHLFSRTSLQRLIERAGFADIEIVATGKRVSAEFVGGLLSRKYPRLLGPLGRLTSLPIVRSISASYGLGDLVTVTAIRPQTESAVEMNGAGII